MTPQAGREKPCAGNWTQSVSEMFIGNNVFWQRSEAGPVQGSCSEACRLNAELMIPARQRLAGWERLASVAAQRKRKLRLSIFQITPCDSNPSLEEKFSSNGAQKHVSCRL